MFTTKYALKNAKGGIVDERESLDEILDSRYYHLVNDHGLFKIFKRTYKTELYSEEIYDD